MREIKIGDFVDYGGIICEVKVVSNNQIVIRNKKSLYRVRIDDENLTIKQK